MARADWQYVNGSTNNNSVFFTGIRWRYRDDLFGTTGYPSDRTTSNIDIIEYQPFSGRKQSYNTFSYTSWKTSYYRYSYNTVSGQEPDTASNTLNISTTFRFDKATNNTKYYPVKGSLSSANVFNISSNDTSRIIQVPHCSDGTSKVRLFFHYTGDSNTAFSYGETNAVITLETIPRASSITVNDANIGSSTNIVINKASSSFTTTLSYKASGQNDWTTIVTKTPNQVYGWVVPTSFYSLIPNSRTISCEIKADTYSDDTLVGTKTSTATFTATGNPIINSSSAVDTNSTTIALTGNSANMVKYASNVQVSVNVSGQNSASVSSVTINGNNVSLSGTNPKTGSITFNGATTNSFEIKVTDSRGYQTTTTHTMTMVNYVPLTISATIKRNQPTDEKVNISFNGNYFNGSFGSQNNTLTVQYRWKPSTDSWEGHDWTNAGISTSISNNTYSGGTGNTPLTGFDYTKSYNFEIRATDKVGTKQITGITVTKGEPVYWWDNDEFNVNGKLGVSGNLNGKGVLFSNGKIGVADGVTGVAIGGGGIEISHSTPYIDFHYNNSTSDYTSRIIETSSGKLQVTGKLGVADDFQTKRKFLYSLDAGGGLTGRFYKLVNIPASDDANAIQVNIRGSIGNWGSNGKATIDIQIANRNGLNVYGIIYGNITALDNQRIVIQQESNNTHTVYLYCAGSYVGANTLEISWGKYGAGSNVTIYTDNSYTTSPSGTQVWNIGTSSSLNANIVSLNGTTTGTGVVTRSGGATLSGSSYRKYGNVVQLNISLTTTSSTGVGSNAFTGQLSNSSLYPPLGANAVVYNASSAVIGAINDSGAITVRVTGATLANGSTFTLRFIYII